MSFMEMGVYVVLWIFFLNSSSLFMSILLIPLSFLLMFSSTSLFYLMTPWLFMLIFVGGVLILLVGVSSVMEQDEIGYLSKMWATLLLLILLNSNFNSKSNYLIFKKSTIFINWINYSIMVMVILSFLTLSLVIITSFLMEYKSMSRKIYYNPF